MNFFLEIIDDSEPEIISLQEAKQFLRLENDLDDNLILSLIKSARKIAENYLKRSITSKIFELEARPKSNYLYLPFGPAKEVIKLIDSNGKLISRKYYHLTTNRQFLYIETVQNCLVTYKSSSLVRENLKLAMLNHISVMYEDRIGDGAIPQAALKIYNNVRKINI